MSYVEWESRPELHRPILVCAFAGWNDGGEAASTAARYLRDELGAAAFAHVDPEEFFDFQVHRPTVRMADGITRRIDWPVNDFFLARVEHLRDLLDLELDTGRMEGAAMAWLVQVNEAIEEDGNLAGYVRRLEQAAEEDDDDADAEIPSGDDLAAELERYLRDRGEADP